MDNERLNILKLLIENQEEKFTIRQLSLRRNINYKTAHTAVQQLAAEGVVRQEKQGNTVLCSFTQRFNDTVFAVEYARLQELLKKKDFAVLHNRLAVLGVQFILLLFGSYAAGKQRKTSDIDLLLITDEPRPIETQLHLLPLNIHVTAVTYQEFRTMQRSKEFSVVSEATKRNIILFSIEDYYRLVKHA